MIYFLGQIGRKIIVYRREKQMTKECRESDASFKLEVACMARDQELTVSGICPSMRLGETPVRRWLTQNDDERIANLEQRGPRSGDAGRFFVYYLL